ncbi:hypothetical protein HZS_6750 [Henneguya salminicola]|nr:hypothetical protein HZS_6750 [Henneguya salminicola]
MRPISLKKLMSQVENFKIPLAIFGIFCCCCANVHFLEAILKLAPSCANFITFSQFLFVSSFELIFSIKLFSVECHVPITYSTFF